MSKVVALFPAMAEAEHPAIQALRERMGSLEPEYEVAVQTISDTLADLDKQSLGQPLADAIFTMARDETKSQNQLRGWVAGVFISVLSWR